jgi:hypothetical protein
MKGKTMRTAKLFCLGLTLAATSGLRIQPAAAQASPQAKATTKPTKPSSKVAKIVFLDKKEACECTRQRTAKTWAAMQAALAKMGKRPIERIYVDTQGAKAEAYTVFKPLLVPPGLYFIDKNNVVIDLLQGEVKQQQIEAMLKKR